MGLPECWPVVWEHCRIVVLSHYGTVGEKGRCMKGLLLVCWLSDCWLVVSEHCKVVGMVVGVGYQTWGYCISQMFEAWVKYATWATNLNNEHTYTSPIIAAVCLHKFSSTFSSMKMHVFLFWFKFQLIFTPWPFKPKGYCRCLRPSVRELYFVRTLIRHVFQQESLNLHQTCILGYFQLVFKIRVIDFDLQGYFGHFDLKF